MPTLPPMPPVRGIFFVRQRGDLWEFSAPWGPLRTLLTDAGFIAEDGTDLPPSVGLGIAAALEDADLI